MIIIETENTEKQDRSTEHNTIDCDKIEMTNRTFEPPINYSETEGDDDVLIHERLKRKRFSERKDYKKDNLFYCDQCNFHSRGKSEVNRHVASIHMGVRYSCNQCEYSATQNTNLQRHVKTKHEKAQYQCDQCEYKNGRMDNLVVHRESVHENIRYPCNLCSHKATQKQSLRVHLRVKHNQIS